MLEKNFGLLYYLKKAKNQKDEKILDCSHLKPGFLWRGLYLQWQTYGSGPGFVIIMDTDQVRRNPHLSYKPGI